MRGGDDKTIAARPAAMYLKNLLEKIADFRADGMNLRPNL
jgi:hypothetical protein